MRTHRFITRWLRQLATLALVAGVGTVQAASISGLQGLGAGQSSVLWSGFDGLDGFDRFNTELFADDSLLLQLAGGTLLTQDLRASGDTLRIEYAGTNAGRQAQLALAGVGEGLSLASLQAGLLDPGQALFSARSAGCSYLEWQAGGQFCAIEQIGQYREISGLAAGDALVLGLQAEALASGDAEQRDQVQRWFSGPQGGVQTAAARWLWLDDGRLLLGFEEGGDADFNDYVFLLDGVRFDAPVGAIPEPAALLLTLLAGLAAASLRRRR
jgi:hypothetical protein